MSVVGQIGGLVACLGVAAPARRPRPAAPPGGARGERRGSRRDGGVPAARRVAEVRRGRSRAAARSQPSSAPGCCCGGPTSSPSATLACIPVRLPVDIGAETVNLLLPLYGGRRRAVARPRVAARCMATPARASSARSTLPLAAFVAWTGLTVLWTDDPRRGAIFLAAFVVPFSILAVGFGRLPWRGRSLTWLWGGLVGDGRRVRPRRGVPVGHPRRLLEPGRDRLEHLRAVLPRQLRLLGSVGVRPLPRRRHPRRRSPGIVLAGGRERRVAVLYAVVVTTWLGLLISFSQSSFAALAAGIVVAGAVAWGRRGVVGLVALLALAVAVTFAVPQVRKQIVDRTSSGFDKVTSGRSNLVADGVRIALHHPVQGVGAGGFNKEFARRNHLVGRQQKRAASHTTPVTVAAEQGFVGLALFAWLVAAALVATLVGLGRGFTSRVSLAVGVVLVADLRAQPLLQRVLRGSDDLGDARPRRARLARSAQARRPAAAGGPDYAPAEVTADAARGRRRVIEACRQGARPRAAHRRRRVRLRRHDGAARRGGLRGALRRLLDRDAVAAAGLPARHARTRGARGDGRARHPRGVPHRPRLRRPHVPRAPPGHPRAPRRALGGLPARHRLPAVACTTSTRTTRRSPRRGCARSSARRSSATRSPGTTSTSRTARTSRSRSGTSSARSPRSHATRRSSTAATRTRSTSGTSRACTART